MNKYYKDLKEKISEKNLTVGVIGLGYVGIPLSITIAKHDIKVLGFDISKTRTQILNDKKSYLKGVLDSEISDIIESGKFSATHNFSRLSEPEVLIICVPTPLSKNREPDLSYVRETTTTISKYLRKGQLISLESTTYPGTTSELLEPILESTGLKSGEGFFLAYSPEREDPGNKDFSTKTISKVVGGNGELASDLAISVYGLFIDKVVKVNSTKIAECVKLTENIFRSVNIALVNELKIIFTEMGVDIWDVINAASTKPFGFMPFYPGPGLGGHCIPIDPFYLTWKAHEYGLSTRFIELAGEINLSMPSYVVDRSERALNEHLTKPFNGSKILVVGVAYKKNIDDYRESPALDVINILKNRFADVSYYDPFIPSIDEEEIGEMHSINWEENRLKEFDLAIILTDHSYINWGILARNISLIIDTRNATDGIKSENCKIIKS